MKLTFLVLFAQVMTANPNEAFDRGRTAFARGEYPRAIETLRPLLYPDMRLESEGQVVQAHRMLGVSLLFEKQPVEAEQEFRKLLELRPDYRFDPLLDPPQVVDFFNRILRQQEQDLAAIEAKRKRAEQEVAARKQQENALKSAPVVLEKHYLKNSMLVNFIPFGAGQFQNGNRRMGWFFLSTETVLGGVSVGTFVANFAIYGIRPRRQCLAMPNPDSPNPGSCPDGQIDTSAENNSRTLRDISLITGGLFFATAAWGIADAIWHYQPMSPLPELDGPAPPSRERSTLLTPVMLPTGNGGSTLGASLAFRF